jgi:hypothetical protein
MLIADVVVAELDAAGEQCRLPRRPARASKSVPRGAEVPPPRRSKGDRIVVVEGEAHAV